MIKQATVQFGLRTSYINCERNVSENRTFGLNYVMIVIK